MSVQTVDRIRYRNEGYRVEGNGISSIALYPDGRVRCTYCLSWTRSPVPSASRVHAISCTFKKRNRSKNKQWRSNSVRTNRFFNKIWLILSRVRIFSLFPLINFYIYLFHYVYYMRREDFDKIDYSIVWLESSKWNVFRWSW